MEEMFDSLQVDSLQVDSLMQEQPDSIANAGQEMIAMVFEAPKDIAVDSHETSGWGFSLLLTVFLALFVFISIRFRKNTRFFMAMLNELVGMRDRPNTFDDTVRETSFLLMLNVLWCMSVGFLLYGLLCRMGLQLPFLIGAGGVTGEGGMPVIPVLICIGMAVAYTIFMWLAYGLVGIVFTDPGLTAIWVKGFLSAQGLEALVMFPLALLSLTIPGLEGWWLLVAGIAFAVTKIIFIYKGFRIFFNQTASWVIFLYYLCSLEIVPLILTCIAAFQLCSLLA